MKVSSKQYVLRWIMIAISFLIVSLILWNTYRFFQTFKEEERIKMENFSQAQIELAKSSCSKDFAIRDKILCFI